MNGQELGTYSMKNKAGKWFDGSAWKAHTSDAARYEGTIIDARQHARWLEREARKYYKVWVSGPHTPGYLRLGHAWKTKAGATTAMLEYMKEHNIRGYIGLSRNENDAEIGE